MKYNYIKIMPEYGCSPIWIGIDGDLTDNVEIEAICDNLVLINEFNNWNCIFQKIYNPWDPEAAGFEDKESLFAFEMIGINLWNSLNRLISNKKIEYFSLVFNKEYNNIVELQRDLDSKALYLDSFVWVKP